MPAGTVIAPFGAEAGPPFSTAVSLHIIADGAEGHEVAARDIRRVLTPTIAVRIARIIITCGFRKSFDWRALFPTLAVFLGEVRFLGIDFPATKCFFLLVVMLML